MSGGDSQGLRAPPTPSTARASGRLAAATLVALTALAAASAAGLGAVAPAALEGVAREAAERLAEVGDELREEPPTGEGPSLDELAALSGASPVEIPRGWIERAPLPSATGTHKVRAPGADAPPLGILVRADLVRAAIARGGRPSGTPIEASGDRPAGLVLSGVTAYGSALRDGDILTRVGGTPATTASRVIGAVAGAVRSRVKAIDGEVWRGGRRIPVVVELPPFRTPKRKKG